jgi:type II secretory pathway pseudopilin PulG
MICEKNLIVITVFIVVAISVIEIGSNQPQIAMAQKQQLQVNQTSSLQKQQLLKGIYPALGGDLPGNFALNSTEALAANVKGLTVPLSGHWIPEEQPGFVIEQLFKYFGNSTNASK